jgi:hypothetical protein
MRAEGVCRVFAMKVAHSLSPSITPPHPLSWFDKTPGRPPGGRLDEGAQEFAGKAGRKESVPLFVAEA